MNNPIKVDSILTYYGKGITPKYVTESSIIVLNQRCIRNNKIDYAFAQYIDDQKNYNEEKFLKVGDILINSTGQGTAGRVAFVEKLPFSKKVIIDSHILIIRTENYFQSKCLNYSLFSIESKLQTFMDGSTGQGEFDKQRLFNIIINYSQENSVQKKIANILGDIDNKISINNQVNDNLERMAKTLYDYWFVQFDFPDENGKPYKSSGGKMIWNGILRREIPEDWEFETIEALGTITGGSTPSKAIVENFSKNGIPWITPKDLSQNTKNKFIARGEFDITEKGLREASLNILPANSVLMSSRAPIGYLAINRFDCTTNQGFKSIICNKEYPFEYVFYVLKQNMLSIEANASGSTFKEISTAILKTIKILKPQKRLVNQFKNIASVIFQQQNNLEQQNQHLTSLRDWLLPMLMNGQVKIE